MEPGGHFAAVPRYRTVSLAELAVPGVVAGIVGAIGMWIFAGIVAITHGQGFFTPMELISATFLRNQGVPMGAGPIILGFFIHFVVGAFWGVLFAGLLPWGLDMGRKLFVALIYAGGVFLFMSYLVMPWASPPMYAQLHPWWFLAYHGLYGLCLWLVLPLRREVHTTLHPAQAHA